MLSTEKLIKRTTTMMPLLSFIRFSQILILSLVRFLVALIQMVKLMSFPDQENEVARFVRTGLFPNQRLFS